jgi:hypothetical protein
MLLELGPLSIVGAKGVESGSKDHEIQRPFHPDGQFLRKVPCRLLTHSQTTGIP